MFLLIFIAFNLFMLAWFIGGLSVTGSNPGASDAENAGRAVGAAIGMGIVMFIWACGSIILGLLAFFTRGRKLIIEELWPSVGLRPRNPVALRSPRCSPRLGLCRLAHHVRSLESSPSTRCSQADHPLTGRVGSVHPIGQPSASPKSSG